jgi:hypothetical protein
MGRRVERTRCGGTWTEARYWSFIRSALRKASTRYPVKFEVLNEGRRRVYGKKHKYEYQCNHCNKWFQRKEVSVDHIVPAGSLKRYADLPGFTERLFCEKDNMHAKQDCDFP